MGISDCLNEGRTWTFWSLQPWLFLHLFNYSSVYPSSNFMISLFLCQQQNGQHRPWGGSCPLFLWPCSLFGFLALSLMLEEEKSGISQQGMARQMEAKLVPGQNSWESKYTNTRENNNGSCGGHQQNTSKFHNHPCSLVLTFVFSLLLRQVAGDRLAMKDSKLNKRWRYLMEELIYTYQNQITLSLHQHG